MFAFDAAPRRLAVADEAEGRMDAAHVRESTHPSQR